MKFTVVLSALVGAAMANPLLADRAQCNADNCLRVVRGSAATGMATRLAACSTFQACSVQLPPVTQTSTVTVTTAAPAPPTATCANTAVPGYAQSSCMNTSRFASACSCAGITQSTTTLSASTVTAVTTVTVTTPATTPASST